MLAYTMRVVKVNEPNQEQLKLLNLDLVFKCLIASFFIFFFKFVKISVIQYSRRDNFTGQLYVKSCLCLVSTSSNGTSSVIVSLQSWAVLLTNKKLRRGPIMLYCLSHLKKIYLYGVFKRSIRLNFPWRKASDGVLRCLGGYHTLVLCLGSSIGQIFFFLDK